MNAAIKQAGDALTAVAAYPEIRQYIGTVLHDQIREALAALSAEQTEPVAYGDRLGTYYAKVHLAPEGDLPEWMQHMTPLYIAAPASQPDAAAIRRKALEELTSKIKQKFDGWENLHIDTVFAYLDDLATQSEPAQQELQRMCDFRSVDPAEWSDTFECSVCKQRYTYAAEDCMTAEELNKNEQCRRSTAQQAGQPAQEGEKK